MDERKGTIKVRHNGQYAKFFPTSLYGLIKPSDESDLTLEDELALIKAENTQLRTILVMLANMNGASLDTNADMDDILNAFRDVYDNRNETQFLYGNIDDIIL